MSTETKFEWTDELVSDFFIWYKNTPRPIYDPIKTFKDLKKAKEEIVPIVDEFVNFTNEIHFHICDSWHIIKKERLAAILIANDKKLLEIKESNSEDKYRYFAQRYYTEKECLELQEKAFEAGKEKIYPIMSHIGTDLYKTFSVYKNELTK